jgi:cell division protein FtsL
MKQIRNKKIRMTRAELWMFVAIILMAVIVILQSISYNALIKDQNKLVDELNERDEHGINSNYEPIEIDEKGVSKDIFKPLR